MNNWPRLRHAPSVAAAFFVTGALVAASCSGNGGGSASSGLATLEGADQLPTALTAPASTNTAQSEAGSASATDQATSEPATAETDQSAVEPSAAQFDQEGTAEQQVQEEVSDEQALLNFAECMRENGLPEFPDPMVDSEGRIDLRGSFADAGIQPNSEEFRLAMDTCNHHLEGVALGRGGGELDQVEEQDTLLDFAQCLREEGIEVDDPDLSNFTPGQGGGQGGGAGLFGEAFNPQDSDVQAALEVCREATGGFGAFGPGTGGRPGAGGGNQGSN